MVQFEPCVLVQNGLERVVVVLVDDEKAEIAQGLPLERLQQAPWLVDAADRREDEVE